jgi:hypothetical protein
MKGFSGTEDEERRSLQLKYDITAWFYDILDYPWERQYRHWRPQLVADIHGEVLEAGVGRKVSNNRRKTSTKGVDYV